MYVGFRPALRADTTPLTDPDFRDQTIARAVPVTGKVQIIPIYAVFVIRSPVDPFWDDPDRQQDELLKPKNWIRMPWMRTSARPWGWLGLIALVLLAAADPGTVGQVGDGRQMIF